MATTINSKHYTDPAQVLADYRVTLAQVESCERVQEADRVFYLVNSTSQPGTRYQVVYNRDRGGLQCLPYEGGRTCPASAAGNNCFHKRAAVAHEMLYQMGLRQRRENERLEVEATDEYRIEQAECTAIAEAIADAERQLASAEPEPEYSREATGRERMAVALDGERAFTRPEVRRDERGRLLA